MRVHVVKVEGGYLIPAGDVDKEEIDKLRSGVVYLADLKKERNSLFHRKVLALLRLGFDCWEPKVLEGDQTGFAPEKNFEAFREKITILAGHYFLVCDLDGKVYPKAKSISFAAMDEIEFEALFSSFVDVLLRDILSRYTRSDIDNIVDQIIGFTS